MANRASILNVENANIMFKNFSGMNDRFNKDPNKRNFALRIDDPDLADMMASDGWNVRTLKARDEGDPDTHYIRVNVEFNGPMPPNVWLIKECTRLDGTVKRIKQRLTIDTIEELDHEHFKSADVVVRPYTWNVGGKHGVAAYLKSLYVVVEGDAFEAKYFDEDICD